MRKKTKRVEGDPPPQKKKKYNSPVALPRLLDTHVHDLALHVFFNFRLRVASPPFGQPVPEHCRAGLKHDHEVEPALREEVASVEVDDAASRGEGVLEGVDDLF